MPSILMTGAAGGVGTRLRKLQPQLYPDLRLSDLKAPADLGARKRSSSPPISPIWRRSRRLRGIDSVIHLGGYSVEGPWERSCSPTSSAATTCSRRRAGKGVKRVVFASSNHAVGFYPRQRQIGTDVTARPD